MPKPTPPPSDAEIARLVESMAPPSTAPDVGDPPVTAAAVSAGEVAVGAGAIAQLVATVERLFDRVDKQEEGSRELLAQVLAQHGEFLKKTLSPENKLHPDVSDLNPLGERDNPRPRLKRPCFFLGVPLEQPSLTRDEIELLNSFDEPLELADKKWRVAFLRDGGGGEALYISVPFRSFDDLRSIEGGWQRVLRDLKGGGGAPVNNDSLLKRIAALEAILASGRQFVATPPPADPDVKL